MVRKGGKAEKGKGGREKKVRREKEGGGNSRREGTRERGR